MSAEIEAPISIDAVCDKYNALLAENERHRNFLGHLINNLYGNPNIKQSVLIAWIDDHLDSTTVRADQEGE